MNVRIFDQSHWLAARKRRGNNRRDEVRRTNGIESKASQSVLDEIMGTGPGPWDGAA